MAEESIKSLNSSLHLKYNLVQHNEGSKQIKKRYGLGYIPLPNQANEESEFSCVFGFSGFRVGVFCL